jgi:hypothetical protein
MSAIGLKQTRASALHLSAFGGKADVTFCENPLSGRYWGQSGRAILHCIRLLVTQSGHLADYSHDPQSAKIALPEGGTLEG